MTRRKLIPWTTAATAVFLLVAVVLPSVSGASFSIVPGSVKVRSLNAVGDPENAAGAHPDRLQVAFEFNRSGTSARDLIFEFGPGFSGTPTAVPQCPRAAFELETCPPNTQVGVFGLTPEGETAELQPIFNLAPAPTQTAALAFKPFWESELELNLRPTDYGLTIATYDQPEVPVNKGQVELWGVPADHLNAPKPPRTAFLTSPTQCGPLKIVFRTRSWEVGAPWLEETAQTEPYTGCEGLPFAPQLDMKVENPTVDSPTPANLSLTLPEHSGPDERVTSNMKDVRIDLPPGFTVATGGVEGREVCQDAQFGLGTESLVTCPFHSRVGTIRVSSPSVNQPLVGPIYLGSERPGERFRLFVNAVAPGIQFKSGGTLVANPVTGQLSALLNGLPQVALSSISLEFDGGSQGILATPLSCGQAVARAHFTPYSGGPAVDSSSTMNIENPGGAACQSRPPFSPGLVGGTSSPKAGQDTGFTFVLLRKDGEQLPGKFSTTLPPGFNANLKGVQLCTNAGAEKGNCPAGSRVGTAFAELGSGSSAAKVGGTAYLTEAFEGAPYGLAIMYKASIGPYDLGSLIVHGTLKLNPRTGQVTFEHTLPSTFEGVQLRFKTIMLTLDRPGFVSNPTSCEPEAITSTVYSIDGRVAQLSAPFRVGSCNALGFKPKFSMALSEKAKSGKPKLKLGVQMHSGQTNLRRFGLTVPRALIFHAAAIRNVCPRGDAMEDKCSPASRVGTGVANTPLLNTPLRGPVYLVQPKGGGFPDLWSSLEGSGVKIQMASEATQRHGVFSAEMVDLPDLPMTSFAMEIDGGKKGLFSVKGDPCRSAPSLVTLEGQDGAIKTAPAPLQAGCATAHRKKKAARERASAAAR